MKTIFFNGNIITMDKNQPYVDSIIVEEDKFIFAGKYDDAMKLIGQNDKMIDLKGKTVIPGFNDSHVHLLNYGYSLTKIDCNGIKSIEEVIEKSKKYIYENKIEADKWVCGRGWNQTHFKEGRYPNRYDLDKISTTHPMVFTRICEHVVVANSLALKKANIDKSTENPIGGEIERDENGEPTGVLKENARYLIYSKIPDATIEEIKTMLVKGVNKAISYGLTSLQTDDFETFSSKNWRKILKAYDELIAENRLPIRIYEQCLLPDVDRLKEFLSEGYRTGIGNENFKIGPLKLLTDGSLGMKTAYLDEPYSDDPNSKGISVFAQEKLDELSSTAVKGGMNLVLHAIGDGAINMCLKSFEKARKISPIKDNRFGLIHIQILSESIINKFKELNVVAYMEPICINTDLYIAESRVGKERMKTSYVYKRLCDEGLNTCISSDCPVDSLNPMDSIYVATNRKDYNGYPNEGWIMKEALSVEEALRGLTLGGAYASYEENIKGSIENGKLADFIIISDDIMNIDKKDIKDIKVEATYLGGKKVYSI